MNHLKIVIVISCILAATMLSGCVVDETGDEFTIYVDSKGTKEYTSIQEAIDNAPENYTVFVYAGTYYENIYINKSVDLKGQDKLTTIIDGNNTDDVIFVDKGGRVNISGFTIQNSGPNEYSGNDAGIEITSDNNNIMDTILYNNTIGIYTSYSDYNIFKQNLLDSNKKYGMYLYTATDYAITTENTFINNYCGLRIKGSTHNNVTKNIFKDNDEGMYFCCGARLNKVSHNTFLNNSIWNGNDYVGGNEWDAGYPTGGNYWDDYNGVDMYSGSDQNMTGADGIGDNAYNVTTDGSKIDNYPLIEPIVTP